MNVFQNWQAERGTLSSRNKKTVALFLTAVCCCAPVYAQKGGAKPAPAAQERANDKPPATKGKPGEVISGRLLERRLAIERLEGIGERAKNLNNSITKIKILAKVADALWEHDEARARQLFTSAFQAIDAIELDAKQDQRVATAESERASGPLLYLRSSVLQLVARRDFKLAEALRRSLEKGAAEGGGRRSGQFGQEELEHIQLDVAGALAKTHPDESARLIRGLLQNGIGAAVVATLLRMRAENQRLADQLFVEAVASARARRAFPADLESLSVYVLPTEEDVSSGRNPANDPARAPVIGHFLDYVYAELLRQADQAGGLTAGGAGVPAAELAEHEYRTLRTLLPLFSRVQPERAAVVRERMASLLALMTPQAAGQSVQTPRRDVDELIRQAEATVDERQRLARLVRASEAALRQGDVQKAVDTAQRISDPYERKIQTSVILFQAAGKELRAGELDRAYAYAREIEFLPQRVSIFHRMAQKLWAGKESERARAMLEEILEWLGKADNGPQKADAVLKIAATMAQYDAERGFEFFQSAAKALNDADFSYKPPDPKRLSVEVQPTLDMLDLESSFAAAARNNSERAFQIAQSLTKPEASLLAQAAVCHQVLASR